MVRGGRRRPLAEVRADFESAHETIVRLIASLTDGALLDPGRFAWLGFPAGHAVAGNSYGHYLEHAEMVTRVGGSGSA